MTERIRELSFEERARWGECPVCHARDGEACNDAAGDELGMFYPYFYDVDKRVHFVRVLNAPLEVREVPCES